MAKDLRETWKETGKGLGHAFRDLGKSIVKSGTNALKKADQWASSENEKTEETEKEEE